jgi:hypothetical protein
LRDRSGVLGFLLGSCRGYRAFNADGQPIEGYFDSKEAAVDAICFASTAQRGGNSEE